jgi:hypothetical protein
MSTIQELNELLKEAQEEIEIWQQAAILLLLVNTELETGEGMTEDEVEERLAGLTGGLRAAREKMREMGIEPDMGLD